ncbi:acyl carrier protein [Gyrodon lividus]|nr:acyl carrier protein [Gyrodon lividus]
MSFARITFRSLSRARPTFAVSKQSAYRLHRANFSAAAGISKEDIIQARVFNVLKGFEKVDAAKISTSASFADDLALDSLDTVEVVMAVEEEFAIEIPDAEADEIKTVQQAIDYIVKTPEAH